MSGEKAEPSFRATEEIKEGQATTKLSQEVIEYLSKEIETTTNNMMVFRSKIAFAVFIGPFIILGSVVVATKGLAISLSLDSSTTIYIIAICLCYFALAFISVRIEKQAWRQCNKWRGIIEKLHNNPSSVNLDAGALSDDLFEGHKGTIAYFAAYLSLLAAFILTIIIIAKINVTPLPVNSPNGISPSSSKDSEPKEQKD